MAPAPFVALLGAQTPSPLASMISKSALVDSLRTSGIAATAATPMANQLARSKPELAYGTTGIDRAVRISL